MFSWTNKSKRVIKIAPIAVLIGSFQIQACFYPGSILAQNTVKTASTTTASTATKSTTTKNSNIIDVPLGDELSKGNVMLESRTAPKADINLTIQIKVPHGLKATESFIAYPYPPRVPPGKPIEALPTDKKVLKDMLLNSGYSNRFRGNKAYAPMGWRWEYAFNAAVRRSGKSFPHTIATMYPWTSSMVPYIVPEIERINKGEENRQLRYMAAVDEFNKTHMELENEAVRKGLYPTLIRRYRKGEAGVKLSAGNWWITVTRSVPGLQYYWRVPITIVEGQPVKLTLTEQNALLVQGGW